MKVIWSLFLENAFLFCYSSNKSLTRDNAFLNIFVFIKFMAFLFGTLDDESAEKSLSLTSISVISPPTWVQTGLDSKSDHFFVIDFQIGKDGLL